MKVYYDNPNPSYMTSGFDQTSWRDGCTICELSSQMVVRRLISQGTA